MMTERRRVLTLLSGGRPDRVPWFGDLDYWATALIGRGERPADFKASDAYIDWHRGLRCGFYLQGYFPFRTIVENCGVAEWREGNARRRRVETPRGTLTETWTWLAESFAEAPTERLVKAPADLAAYRYLFDPLRARLRVRLEAAAPGRRGGRRAVLSAEEPVHAAGRP
jgi:hypothetical protein